LLDKAEVHVKKWWLADTPPGHILELPELFFSFWRVLLDSEGTGARIPDSILLAASSFKIVNG
jgi:hypothetical protein